MTPKLVCLFLVLSFVTMLHQVEGCLWGSGCHKRDCSLSSWSKWSSCSQPCGTEGVQIRYRRVTRSAKCGGSCSGSLTQTRSCNRECPNGGTPDHLRCNCKTGYSGRCCTGVDGGWSDWSAWNSCNETCGTGFQERFRNCTQPAPENSGKNCKGEAQQKQLCQLPPCPVDGGWSDWSEWTPCSELCGGFQERFRNCTSPEPSFGGKPCEGEEWENNECDNLCEDISSRL